MRKLLTTAAMLGALTISGAAFAEQPTHPMLKTRLDHFSGTNFVLVVSYLHSEITSVTCERWAMLGIDSWKGQNNFTIPAANPNSASVAVMNAKGFEGYCKGAGSIVAHTDEGDYVGKLDRGPGNWKESTKLTIDNIQQ